MTYRKPKFIALRMGLIAILVAIFAWSYIQFSDNYERVELSQKMVTALLDDKVELAREYADQLGIVQKNLDRTESFLVDIRMENQKLKEKIKLLDQMKYMEEEIDQLRNQNAEIQAVMDEVSDVPSEELTDQEFMFKTIEKGRSLIKEFKQKIHQVKRRLNSIKKEEHERKVAIQQEIDRKESLFGNNGFLVKDGQSTPAATPDLKVLPGNAKIKVEFVK